MKEFLDVSTVLPDPITQFNRWFAEALASGIQMPEAMTLATIGLEGAPSARIVLLKEVNERGFIFFTNYLSRKGKELEQNPFASLVFHWSALERQVRIVGKAERVGDEESDAYFRTRPRESQLSATISPQSERVAGREQLERWALEAKMKFENKEIPRPAHWGGYRIIPHRIEFWQGREGRLHDRIEYLRADDGSWNIHRLAP